MIERGAERLVIRTPNHLGELVLALPALGRAARREAEGGRPAPLVQVPNWLVPVLALTELPIEPVTLAGRRAVVRSARDLRRAAAGAALRAVTLTPSFSSALTLRLAGVRTLRGTRGGGRTPLLTDPVDREPLLAGHRVNEFLVLCGFSASAPPDPPAFTGAGVERALAAWGAAEVSTAARGAVALADGPVVGVFPGANGPARRWPVERFGDLAGRLGRAGAVVLVFGGPGDRGITAVVAGRGGDRALDLGGRTSLEELAGGLRSCDLLVTNDTGPMHLAAALGTPVLALEGPADLRQTRPLGRRVRLLGRFDLPCVPCVKNACPRRGAGYVLPRARRECMYLVEVDEVETAVNEMLSEESV
ncbi:MAG TPA: glycosyltransferase family 9 protein [Gemmatimonadota bacterium]|nr:glycosyltransferase family 9 protein [Gemmatimonadota bacterium]